MKNNLQISKPLIVIGVLKANVKWPITLFLKSIFTLKRHTKNCNIDIPKDFIKTNGLIVSLYINLQNKFTKQEAFEIVRECIMTVGFAIQQNALNCVKEKRTFENLIKNQKFMKENGATKHNTMVIKQESKNKYHFEVTKCMFYKFFNSLNVTELTTIFCDIDNAVFSSYLPNQITFGRGGKNNTIPNGADKCTFIMEKHTTI